MAVNTLIQTPSSPNCGTKANSRRMVSITYCKQKASTAILFCCKCLCHLPCCLTLDSIAADMSASLHELCIVKLTKSIPDGIHILDYSMLYSCYIYCIFLCSTLASIKRSEEHTSELQSHA